MAKPIFGIAIPDAVDVPIEIGTGDNTVNPEADNIQAFINAACPPTNSYKPTYLANGEVNFLEVFSGPTQTTPNRIARVDLTYTGDDPTTEAWKLYDSSDGTTINKTVTLTHVWTANDWTSTTTVTT
jgi:hypothetical protein